MSRLKYTKPHKRIIVLSFSGALTQTSKPHYALAFMITKTCVEGVQKHTKDGNFEYPNQMLWLE